MEYIEQLEKVFCQPSIIDAHDDLFDGTHNKLAKIRGGIESLAAYKSDIASSQRRIVSYTNKAAGLKAKLATCPSDRRDIELADELISAEGDILYYTKLAEREELDFSACNELIRVVAEGLDLSKVTPNDIAISEIKNSIGSAIAEMIRKLRRGNSSMGRTQETLEGMNLNVSMVMSDASVYLKTENEYAELDYLYEREGEMTKALKLWEKKAKTVETQYKAAEFAHDKEGMHLNSEIMQKQVIPELESAGKNVARLKFLKKKYFGKVRNRKFSGELLSKEIDKLVEKYYPVVERKYKLLGLIK